MVFFLKIELTSFLACSARFQDDDASSPVRSALRGGDWLLADRNEQEVLAEPGRQQLVPIKSVRGQGLRIDLSAEMGDCCTF